MVEEFNRILPGLLGALYDIVSGALDRIDEVEAPTELRMADAAHWLLAAETACCLPDGTFVDTISSNQKDLMVDKIINDSLVVAIGKVIACKPFEGTVGDLFTSIDQSDYSLSQGLPTTPSHLSNALKRLRPALVHAGIEIEFGEKTRKGKVVQIRRTDVQDYKASIRDQS